VRYSFKTMKKERDYCLFIDCRKYNRNAGCQKHDNAYGINGGGTEADRKRADRAFYDYMTREGDSLALLCYIVCRSFGWLFFNYHGKPWNGQLVKRLFRCYKPG